MKLGNNLQKVTCEPDKDVSSENMKVLPVRKAASRAKRKIQEQLL